MPQFVVTLTGAVSFRTPSGEQWKARQSRTFTDTDPDLAYYRQHRAFNVGELVAPSQRPSKAEPKVEESVPLAAPTPSVPETEPEELKSDAELSTFNKAPLLDYATELGLSVSDSMTKAEIRAEIDTRR